MITRTEIDGIPVLSTPDGPVAAGITFRVGYADETLARHGITHLTEHLALHRLGVTDYHYNGATAPDVTSFFSQGSPETVTAYLTRVCEALADLPMERLELEKEILRTEADGRSRSVTDRLWLWRYGSRGPGLAALPEWGLGEIVADELRSWVARYFTRGNAVVWVSGMPLPDALRLPLPPGPRQPLPVIPEALPELPACFPDLAGKFAYQARVPRSVAGRMYTSLLQREMFRRLRQEGGYSYSVATGYEPAGVTTAEIYASADIADEREGAAVGAFVDVLASLRWGTIDPADLVEIRARLRSDLDHPMAESARLPGEAADLLIGGRLLQRDELLAEADAVTPQDVQQVAEQAAATALLLTPRGLTAEWAGFHIAPNWSPAPVSGPVVGAHGEPGRQLVIGAEGVSETSQGNTVAVAYHDCQVMLAWPDGGRLLVGSDAISCAVEPTLYPLDPQALRYLDQRIPGSLVVRMPPRSPDDIPAPPAPPPRPAGLSGPARNRSIAGIVVLGLLALFMLFWAIATTALLGDSDPDVAAGAGVIAVVSWLAVAGSGFGIWRLARRLR